MSLRATGLGSNRVEYDDEERVAISRVEALREIARKVNRCVVCGIELPPGVRLCAMDAHEEL